jgi:hypothetical protein
MARIAALCAIVAGSVLGLTAFSDASVTVVPSGNLVQNPGAESVTTSGSRLKPTGWKTDPAFVALRYADAGPFVVGTSDKPDPPRGAPSSGGSGGSNYFSGPACRTAGCADNPYNNLGAALDNSGSQASQSISVAGAAAEIDAGGVKATLGAKLGGYRGLTTVTATFLDGSGARLGAITIGPAGGDAMSTRSSTQAVPAKTRTVTVVLAERRADASVPGYGFFDNISLTLGGGTAPPTTTAPPTAGDPIEGTWIFDRNVVVISRRGAAGHFVGVVTKPAAGSCYKRGQTVWTISKAGAKHYTGTHLSHHKDCSPDPDYPAVWDLVTVGGTTKLKICVTARDGFKACETLSRPGAADTIRPRAKALASSGQAGTLVRLRFQASDDSGTTSEEIKVYRGSTLKASMKTAFGTTLAGHTYYINWKAPGSAVGTHRFCVRAFDRAGNVSPAGCAALQMYP